MEEGEIFVLPDNVYADPATGETWGIPVVVLPDNNVMVYRGIGGDEWHGDKQTEDYNAAKLSPEFMRWLDEQRENKRQGQDLSYLSEVNPDYLWYLFNLVQPPGSTSTK